MSGSGVEGAQWMGHLRSQPANQTFYQASNPQIQNYSKVHVRASLKQQRKMFLSLLFKIFRENSPTLHLVYNRTKLTAESHSTGGLN